MSNELAVVEKNPIAEIEQSNKILDALMRLPHYQKMGADTVFAIVAKAKSLDMDPVYALNGGLYAIKGKVGMPAESMAAMIRSKGHSITKDKASNGSCCILHGKRADNGDTWTIKFTLEDAKRAGIYSNTWEKYPETMCYNRAMSFLARQLFPDVIKGAGYTMDELREIAKVDQVDESKLETVEVEVETISEKQLQELLDLLDGCAPEYRDSVITSLSKLPTPIKTLDKLPTNLYDRLKKAALQKSAEFKMKNVSKEEEEQIEVA